MSDALVSIDKAGRIVLPKNVREELAIYPGDLLEVSVHGDHVALRPNREKVGFIKRGKALVFSTGGADVLNHEVVEAVRGSERGSLSLDIAKNLPHQKRK